MRTNYKIEKWGENLLQEGTFILNRAVRALLDIMADQTSSGEGNKIVVELLDNALIVKATGGKFKTPVEELLTSENYWTLKSGLGFLNREGLESFRIGEKLTEAQTFTEYYSLSDGTIVRNERNINVFCPFLTHPEEVEIYDKYILATLSPVNMPGVPWENDEKQKLAHENVISQIQYAVNVLNREYSIEFGFEDNSLIGMKLRGEETEEDRQAIADESFVD